MSVQVSLPIWNCNLLPNHYQSSTTCLWPCRMCCPWLPALGPQPSWSSLVTAYDSAAPFHMPSPSGLLRELLVPQEPLVLLFDTRSMSGLGRIPVWEIQLFSRSTLSCHSPAVAKLRILSLGYFTCFGFGESDWTKCTWHLLLLYNSITFVGFPNTWLHHPCLNYSANPVR